SISFLEGAGAQRTRHDLPLGPEPGGLALSADGDLAFVTLSADGELAVLDVATRSVMRRVPLGPLPWAVATTGSGPELTVIVSHRLARAAAGHGAAADGREAWLSLIRGLDTPATHAGVTELATTEVVLARAAFGFPNALESLVVVGEAVYVAH